VCTGEIVAPNSGSRQEVKKRSILKSIGDYLCRIIDSAINYEKVNYPVIDYDSSKVNMCLKCGDLEIDDNWLRIPHPSKPRISEAIKSGFIIINGSLTVCLFCQAVDVEKRH